MELSQLKPEGSRNLSLTTLEKSVVTLFSSITFAMLAWLVVSVNSANKDLAVVQTALQFIQKDAERSVVGRYTAADAAADKREVMNEFKNIDRRITRLESVHGLEK